MASEQKVAIITGASRGIGASLVEAFRQLGYGIVANSRAIGEADIKSEIRRDSATVLVEGDISSPKTAERVVNAADAGALKALSEAHNGASGPPHRWSHDGNSSGFFHATSGASHRRHRSRLALIRAPQEAQMTNPISSSSSNIEE